MKRERARECVCVSNLTKRQDSTLEKVEKKNTDPNFIERFSNSCQESILNINR